MVQSWVRVPENGVEIGKLANVDFVYECEKDQYSDETAVGKHEEEGFLAHE